MIKPPCKDCEKRQSACHDTCPEYSAWAKARAEMLGKRYDDKGKKQEADSFLIEGIMRRKRRFGGK